MYAHERRSKVMVLGRVCGCAEDVVDVVGAGEEVVVVLRVCNGNDQIADSAKSNDTTHSAKVNKHDQDAKQSDDRYNTTD